MRHQKPQNVTVPQSPKENAHTLLSQHNSQHMETQHEAIRCKKQTNNERRSNLGDSVSTMTALLPN